MIVMTHGLYAYGVPDRVGSRLKTPFTVCPTLELIPTYAFDCRERFTVLPVSVKIGGAGGCMAYAAYS